MRRHNVGFGLTELLISLFVSTLLILILTQHLLAISRQHGHVHTVLDQAMEQQWVFDVIRDRVHHAGFTPCRRLDHLEAIDTRDVPERLLPIEVEREECTGQTKLHLRRMNETAITQAYLKTNAMFFMDKSIKLVPDRPILIANCLHAEVHEIEHIEVAPKGQLVYLKKPLVFEYATQVYVGEWMSEMFYFKKALFYRQHRSDKLSTQFKNISFELEHSTPYPVLNMQFIRADGTSELLKARLRMP